MCRCTDSTQEKAAERVQGLEETREKLEAEAQQAREESEEYEFH